LIMIKWWKHIVGRIMTKLTQRHSVWTSYRASYPTLRIYDEILLFVMDVVICDEIYDEIRTMS
jgi:hypothetical protein